MGYRDNLAAIDDRVAALEHELAEMRRLQLEARALVREHSIEGVLATPCGAPWSKMLGDERVRHCGQCNRHVYNFAALTGDELDALVMKKEGTLCARFFIRGDGTVLTKDCARGRPSRARIALGVGLAVVASVLGGNLLSSLRSPPPQDAAVDLYWDGDEYVPVPPPAIELEDGPAGPPEQLLQGPVRIRSSP